MSSLLPMLILENQFGEVSENLVSGSADVYSGAHSAQVFGPDLNVGATVGSADGSDPKFIATIMGNIIGENLSKSANYLAGVIGAYSLTGTNASTYPTGGVLGIIMDSVTVADGCITAVIDGDSGVTKANAAFKYMMNNSNAGSGVDYGLDLYSPTHDGYLEAAILKADLRLSNELCFLHASGAPTDGGSGTGANFAGPGSQYCNISTGITYINKGSKASPSWKAITTA